MSRQIDSAYTSKIPKRDIAKQIVRRVWRRGHRRCNCAVRLYYNSKSRKYPGVVQLDCGTRLAGLERPGLSDQLFVMYTCAKKRSGVGKVISRCILLLLCCSHCINSFQKVLCVRQSNRQVSHIDWSEDSVNPPNRKICHHCYKQYVFGIQDIHCVLPSKILWIVLGESDHVQELVDEKKSCIGGQADDNDIHEV